MADERKREEQQARPRRRVKRRPRKQRRRALIIGLTLAVVLVVVLAAAWRDGTGFDAIHRFFAYDDLEAGEVTYRYDAAPDNRFAVVGDHLAVLSRNKLSLLDRNGNELCTVPVNLKAPAICAGGGRAAAYDVGGHDIYVLDKTGLVYQLTCEEEEGIIAVSLNAEGWLTVTAEKKNFKGAATVYDAKGKSVFAYQSADRFLLNACTTDDCTVLAAATAGQQESVFISELVFYDLKETEPIGTAVIQDGLVLDMTDRDGRLVSVTDTKLTITGKKGKTAAEYDYQGAFLRDYDCNGDGFTTLLLNQYRYGNTGRLVTVNQRGREIGSLEITDEVFDLSVNGRYVAVLYADRLVIYTRKLEEYASLSNADYARAILARADGSVLLLGAEYAGTYLP